MLSLFYVFCEINRKVSKDLRKERKVQKYCFLFLLGKKNTTNSQIILPTWEMNLRICGV